MAENDSVGSDFGQAGAPPKRTRKKTLKSGQKVSGKIQTGYPKIKV